MASLMPDRHVLVRKRSRLIEDEGQDLCISPLTGFSEHRNKRVNCQPLLSSHDPPVDPSGFSFSAEAPVPMTLEPLYSNVEKFCHHSADNQNFSHMPTPVEPSFPSNAQPSWAGLGPAVSYESNAIHTEECGLDNQDMMAESIPRSIEADMDWSNNSQCVSESGLPSPEMAIARRVRHMSASTVSQDHDMDYEQSPERELPPRMKVPTLQEPASPTQESASSPSWKGHNRSRHTVNSWTWQPGMKRTFSVDYHPDCEKCRQRVPGHFNHIVIS